jgi:hypothetical protein
MRNIAVKRPSLSPTLKWHGFSLAPTWVKNIEENPQESRKEWMVNNFKKAALKNSNNTKNQFWQQHNQPIEVWINEVIEQKKNYIHQNQVEAVFVENDYEYLFSSARDYADIKGLVNIEKI